VEEQEIPVGIVEDRVYLFITDFIPDAGEDTAGRYNSGLKILPNVY
jgi:hypothetical protein